MAGASHWPRSTSSGRRRNSSRAPQHSVRTEGARSKRGSPFWNDRGKVGHDGEPHPCRHVARGGCGHRVRGRDSAHPASRGRGRAIRDGRAALCGGRAWLAALAWPRWCGMEERAGKANGPLPPVARVVYSDFQCPHCALAHRALREARRGSVARIESRHFPLDAECNSHVSKTIHPGACLQAAAAVCA